MKYRNTNSRQIVLMLIIGLMLTRVWSANLNKEAINEKNAVDASKNNQEKMNSNNKQNNFVNPQIVDVLPQKTSVHTITRVSNSDLVPTQICGCASLVKCAPCGVVLFKEEIVDCACAPKPKCPVCPPLSLIHEMAAKRAKEDQKLVNSLRGYTNRMNKLLDGINRYSNDVVQFEMKAKEMAQKMEAAGLKAQVARKNMYKVRKTNFYKYLNILKKNS